jgi:hypothetical protein
MYQNGEKMTELPQNISNDHNIQISNGLKKTNCPFYIPTPTIARPCKIYQNLDFWSENKPSGNTAEEPQFSSNLDRSEPVIEEACCAQKNPK